MKKILIISMSLALFVVTGCDAKESEDKVTIATEVVTEVVEEVTESTTQEEIDSIVIGEIKDNDVMVNMVNSTKETILQMAIKTSTEDEFSENMIAPGEEFLSEYTAEFHWEIEDNILYDIQLTFEDDRVIVLHDINFTDMTTMNIYVENEFAYIKYKSVSSQSEVSTLENEKEWVDNKSTESESTQTASANKPQGSQETTQATTAAATTQSTAPYVVSETPSCSGTGTDKLWSDGRTSHSGPNGEDIFD